MLFKDERTHHSTFLAVMMVLTLMITMQFTVFDNSSGGSIKSQVKEKEIETRALNISLSGREDVMDAANTVIHGEEFEPMGGHLGQWIWTGDINGDDLNDLAIAAPTATGTTGKPNDGKVYIFYGDGGVLPPVIDLKEREPDIVIIGSCDRTLPLIDPRNNATGDMTNEMTAGDYNNDGFRDMVVAFPYSSDGSSLYVIWGDENGLPSYIELNETMSYTTPPPHLKISGLGQAPGGDNLKVPNYLMTEDINGDGIDDLISGGYIGGGMGPLMGRAAVLLGSSTGLSQSLTLGDDQSSSYYGWAVDIGDIDNDGRFDMVVGAPWRDNIDRGLERAGSVFIYFNLTGIVEEPGLLATNVKVINGSGAYDGFGRNVELVDVDGDGYDDVIASAPNADGILDYSKSCGQIFMFRGGSKLSFPRSMDAESDFDTVVIGPEPYEVEGLEANPESIGEIMETGDIDGDGKPEFAIGVSIRNLEPGATGMRALAGSVMLYEMEDIFPPSGGIVHLSHGTPFFTIDGEDMEDSLGFDLEIGDVDNDGLEDILIGAPGADGPENRRPYSGEGYIVRGCGLLIGDITSSGKGIAGPDLLAGGHPVELNISFMNSRGASMIEESVIHLDGSGMDIRMVIEGGSIRMENDPSFLIEPENVIWGYNGIRGWVNLTMSLSWFFPEGEMDLSVDMLYSGEVVSSREFRELFVVKGAFRIGERFTTSVSGKLTTTPGQWHRSGSPFSVSDLDIRYSSHVDLLIPGGSVELRLFDDDGMVDAISYHPESEVSLDGVMEGPRYSNFTIDARIMGSPPSGFSSPSAGEPMSISFNIDDDPPLTPGSLELSIPGEEIGGFSRDGNFDLSVGAAVGSDGDPGGSGTRELRYNTGGAAWKPMMSPGGLFGTYYSDSGFDSVAMERVDPEISFLDWGYWSPKDDLIPPDHFSVRWHGYFNDPENSTMMRLRGHGMAKVMVEGEILLNWTDILYGKSFGPLPARNDPVPLEIYYSHSEQPGKPERAGIILEYRDMDGRWQVLKQGLQHPSNMTHLKGDGGDLDVSVRSVDWVGLSSDDPTVTGHIDNEGPVIDTSWIKEWYPVEEPEIRITVSDGTGSGVNISSVMMETLPEGGQWSTPIAFQRSLHNEEGSEIFIFSGELDEKWRGYLRFTAKDLLENEEISDIVATGVDMEPPEVSLVSPLEKDVLEIGPNRIIWRMTDGTGSGVLDDSVVMRYKSDIYSNNWTDMEPNDLNRTGGYILAGFEMNIFTGTLIEIQLMCSDRAGNIRLSGIHEIEFIEPQINEPPIPAIRSPYNGSVFREGEVIFFDATGTEDDGMGRFDQIHITWFSSISGFLGSGYRIEEYLVPGTHNITLYADDGDAGHNASVSIVITVEEEDYGPSPPPQDLPSDSEEGDVFTYLIVAFFVMVVIGLIFMWLLSRKRSRDDSSLSLGLRERTEDDIEYDE